MTRDMRLSSNFKERLEINIFLITKWPLIKFLTSENLFLITRQTDVKYFIVKL